jgi:hypothetical protein
MQSYGMPYAVLQALWCSGHLSPRDKANLTMACPEVRKWQEQETLMHRKAVRVVQEDAFFPTRYSTYNNVTVSKWRDRRRDKRPTPPVLQHGCSVSVHIDEADTEILSEICSWLGKSEPKHLFFYTCGTRGANRILTDAMLLACALCAEIVEITTNELITDKAMSRLLSCRYAGINNTSVTVRSLRDLPNLVHVSYGNALSPMIDTETLSWIIHMRDSGMLHASVW